MAAVVSIAERFVALSKNAPPGQTIHYVLFNAEEHGIISGQEPTRASSGR